MWVKSYHNVRIIAVGQEAKGEYIIAGFDFIPSSRSVWNVIVLGHKRVSSKQYKNAAQILKRRKRMHRK
jgi:hypothetical protein